MDNSCEEKDMNVAQSMDPQNGGYKPYHLVVDSVEITYKFPIGIVTNVLRYWALLFDWCLAI